MASNYNEEAVGKSDVTALDLVDLENSQAEEVEDGRIVSPRDLTNINFRSLIGHTDEVFIIPLGKYFSKYCYKQIAEVPLDVLKGNMLGK